MPVVPVIFAAVIAITVIMVWCLMPSSAKQWKALQGRLAALRQGRLAALRQSRRARQLDRLAANHNLRRWKQETHRQREESVLNAEVPHGNVMQ